MTKEDILEFLEPLNMKEQIKILIDPNIDTDELEPGSVLEIKDLQFSARLGYNLIAGEL